MRDDDLLMITADHGCDPAAPGTDHTREYVPLIIYDKKNTSGKNFGTLPTFSVISSIIAENFDVNFSAPYEFKNIF